LLQEKRRHGEELRVIRARGEAMPRLRHAALIIAAGDVVEAEHAHGHAVSGIAVGDRFQVMQGSCTVARAHGVNRLQMEVFALLMHIIRQCHGLLMRRQSGFNLPHAPRHIGARAMGQRKVWINRDGMSQRVDGSATLTQPQAHPCSYAANASDDIVETV